MNGISINGNVKGSYSGILIAGGTVGDMEKS